jgi:RNA polymerase sigma-70 factor (TIGR02957 family)
MTSTIEEGTRERWDQDRCGRTENADWVAQFIQARPRLFGIAYRMLGNAAEADDIVQDAWIRWQGADREEVRDPTAFLVTATTRLAINRVKCARARRETYVGTWLPEPVDTSADPALGAERGEALELAVLMLLEKLSATERAAYVLREAFDYDYSDIARIIRGNEVNCRQLVARARKHIADGRRASVPPEEQRRLLEAFIIAAQSANVAALEGLFSSDIVSYSDGGGLVRAARRPVVGRTRIARFVAAVAAHHWSGVTLEWLPTNGQTSALLSYGTEAAGLVTITASECGIEQILWMMRPSKLARARR